MRVRDLNAALAAHGQWLACDAPAAWTGGTIGGLVATADSGPARTGYGSLRDHLLGIAVALPDGSVARSGGRVIKNVAGYDLGKLHLGALGTLGVVTEVTLRLHPLPSAQAGIRARAEDSASLAAAAIALAAAPLEPAVLDIGWHGGAGGLLARFDGGAAEARAARATELLCEHGLEVEPAGRDDAAAHATAQDGGCVVKVSGRVTSAADVLAAADRHRARAVGRAALGLWWLVLDPRTDEEELSVVAAAVRTALTPLPCRVRHAPPGVDPWPEVGSSELALMRRVKARFDPSGVCNPGVYVGGI